MTTHQIKYVTAALGSEAIGEFRVIEGTTVDDIRSGCPNFFVGNWMEDEQYQTYRGFIICTGTVRFSDNIPRKKCVAFLYDHDKKDTFCVSTHDDIVDVASAKKLIDRIVKLGKYWHNMAPAGKV